MMFMNDFLLFRNSPYHFGKQTERKKTSFDGAVDSHRDQNKHQQGQAQRTSAGKRNRDQITPEKIVHNVYQLQEKITCGLQKVHKDKPPSIS
jgi:hypothetical protein